MSESPLLKQLRLRAPQLDAVLLRNNVGMGWIGEGLPRRQPDGSITITLKHARPLHAGLGEGSYDLIGWTRRNSLAIFTAVEAKYGRTATTKQQIAFGNAVRMSGGIAGIVRSVEELEELLRCI